MFTQTQTSSSAELESIDKLQSALIMSGLPSDAFSLTSVQHDNTDYVFIAPTFDPAEHEFATARWVWLVTYDNRFLATSYTDTKGYALPKRDIGTVAEKLHIIDSAPVAAVHTYFLDHNLNPQHITVSISNDYITTPETETTLTIEYTPNPSVPAETKKLELDGWNNATDMGAFSSSSEEYMTTITVADARDVLAETFGTLKREYWQTQSKDAEWSLSPSEG